MQLIVELPRALRRAAASAAVAVAIAALPAPGQAANDPPLTHPAVATKKLQTDLMVAALYCNEKQRYNEFVRRFEPQIAARGNELKALFRKSYGEGGTTALNAAVTRMANEASQRTMADPTGFCMEHGRLFDDVLILSPKELGNFIAAVHLRPVESQGVAVVSAPAAAAPASARR